VETLSADGMPCSFLWHRDQHGRGALRHDTDHLSWATLSYVLDERVFQLIDNAARVAVFFQLCFGVSGKRHIYEDLFKPRQLKKTRTDLVKLVTKKKQIKQWSRSKSPASTLPPRHHPFSTPPACQYPHDIPPRLYFNKRVNDLALPFHSNTP
jgi:hypothetical protein